MPVNVARLSWDLRKLTGDRYAEYWGRNNRQCLPARLFQGEGDRWLEIGAGSGAFFVEMARLHRERFLIAIERSKDRGQRLVRKAERSGLTNLAAFRGNAIPALIHGIPSEALERIYILYPCPWARNSQRKNRWYLHPIMPHLVRILKKNGLLIWASDQKFYIDEARFVCEQLFGLKSLVNGEIAPNPYNDLEHFPGGRTKFEQTFLKSGQSCHELIVQKS